MFITKLWSKLPGKFFCLSTKDGSNPGKWKDYFFSPDDFGKIKQFLLDHADKNIYFCPHGFNRRVRQKADAVLPNMLWADLDFSDPNKMKPKPTIAIESSPGRFVGLWLLKGQMTESLNRRLTYAVDADPGGWDVTQVLRLPGTKNYKYASQPRVRLLWDDGPKWKPETIDKMVPQEDDVEEGGEHLSPSEVFEQYSSKLPRWVRRELLAKKITGRADRSEMLWKLENECIEAGMTEDEAFAVIRNSVWNKFAGRRNEESQLRKEISKAIQFHFKEKPKGKEKLKRKSDEDVSNEDRDEPTRFNFQKLSKVKREKLDFLWYPYLVVGEVSILEGDPGLGKSYLAQMVAGSIAEGKRLPAARAGKGVDQGVTVYFDIENSAGSVTKPRLEDNGFDNLKHYYVVEEPFTIDDDEAKEEIYEMLEKLKPRLIVFDTLNTYIGKADTHKAAESTQAMGWFKELARHFQCSVLVLRHLTKGSGSAMYRGQGSIAFSGSARVVMSVGVDPNDTETRVMAVTKINFAPPPQALEFRIEGRAKGRSEFIWGSYVNLTAQEIMDASSNARAEGKVGDTMQEAMEFLEGALSDGPVEVGKLYRMGEKRSISSKMIERASSKMNIKKKEKQGIEHWKLPKAKKKDTEE